MHLLVLNAGAPMRPGLAGAELGIADPQAFFETRSINTGGFVVHEAMLRHLRASKVSQLGFDAAQDRQHWPKEQPDITIILSSSLLREGLELGHVVPLLRHLKGPVVALGVGAQAASWRRLRLPEGSVAFWRLVAERSASLGVRGAFSAEVLEGIGVRNLRLIGCPSFYLGGTPTRSLKPVPARAARLGLTLNRHLQGDSTPSATLSLLAQRRLLAAAACRPGSRLYAQGEREEMLLVLGAAEQRDAMLRQVLAAYGLEEDPDVRQFLEGNVAAHLTIQGWASDLAQHVDVVAGLRLQGHAMALQQGIPAIPVVHDTRTRELAELFDLPSIEMPLAGVLELDAIIEGAEFGGFEAAYARNFAAYHAFLVENRLPHRLPAPARVPEAARGAALTGGGLTA